MEHYAAFDQKDDVEMVIIISCYLELTFVNQFLTILKNFENLPVEKRRFRLRWDSRPGLSIAGRLL